MTLIREGEKAFASIISTRSGVDSGGIYYRLDVMACMEMSEVCKQELVDTAYALYQSICKHTSHNANDNQQVPLSDSSDG
jgi:hypothetical protein